MVLEFRIDNNQKDNNYYGFSVNNTDLLFKDLIKQNRILTKFKDIDTVIYESKDSNVLIEIQEPEDTIFTEFQEGGFEFSAKTASVIYTNKTNDYLFVPLVKNRGRFQTSEKSENIKTEEFKLRHSFSELQTNTNKTSSDFILLKPKQEISSDFFSVLYSYSNWNIDLSNQNLTLELKYYIFYDYYNSIKNEIENFNMSSLNSKLFTYKTKKGFEIELNDDLDDLSENDIIKIHNSNFGFIESDRAMGKIQCYLINLEGDRNLFISELPNTSPSVKGEVVDGVIIVEFEDVNSKKYRY